MEFIEIDSRLTVNLGKDELWNSAIQLEASGIISELNTLLRLLFGMSGSVNCSIDKKTMVGILFNHEQDSSFVPTLISEKDDTFTSMESPSSSAPSWPASDLLGTLPDSEKALYSNFRMDCSSDESYKPNDERKKKDHGHVDVSMALEDDKNLEATRFGDSKWATQEVPGSSVLEDENWMGSMERETGGISCLPSTAPLYAGKSGESL